MVRGTKIRVIFCGIIFNLKFCRGAKKKIPPRANARGGIFFFRTVDRHGPPPPACWAAPPRMGGCASPPLRKLTYAKSNRSPLGERFDFFLNLFGLRFAFAKSNRSPHGERFDFFFKFFRIQICLR